MAKSVTSQGHPKIKDSKAGGVTGWKDSRPCNSDRKHSAAK